MASVEFINEVREVPDHLADMMVGIETYKMTYQQAIDAANYKQMSDLLNQKQEALIQRHFREHREV